MHWLQRLLGIFNQIDCTRMREVGKHAKTHTHTHKHISRTPTISRPQCSEMEICAIHGIDIHTHLSTYKRAQQVHGKNAKLHVTKCMHKRMKKLTYTAMVCLWKLIKIKNEVSENHSFRLSWIRLLKIFQLTWSVKLGPNKSLPTTWQ